MVVEKSSFPSGETSSPAEGIIQYTLTNSTGSLTVKFLNYGCIITNILVTTKSGVKDIVLGFDDLKGYKSKENAYFGAICGRVANRIADGKFSLNNKTYQLEKNHGSVHLHGGLIGFDQKIFEEDAVNDDETSVTLKYTSPDGEEHYPGSLEFTVKYTLENDYDFCMEYWAKLTEGSTESTILNPTNHTYFNLSGCTDSESSQVLDHRMRFDKDCGFIGVLDKDAEMVPNGKIIALNSKEGEPFNFFPDAGDGKIHTIGERIREVSDYGYDHGFVFSDDTVKMREKLLTVWSPKTDIILSVSTTEPNVHLYTGFYLSKELKSKKTQGGRKVSLGPFSGLCLETQRYPDAVNHQLWRHQVILDAGQQYHQKTVYHIRAL